MGGSSGLGARRTADLLSKATSYLGGIFLTLCVLANFVIDRPESQNSILQSGAPLMQDIPYLCQHSIIRLLAKYQKAIEE